MKHVLFSTLLLMGTSAQAAVLGYGGVASADSATLDDPIIFSGALAEDYFNFGPPVGTFDHFYASLTGTPGQTLSWTVTALGQMDIITTGLLGAVPVTPQAGGGSASFGFSAGETQVLDLMFGSDGILTINTVTLPGAATDASDIFAEGSFALVTDAMTGLSLFGDPSIVGPQSCAVGTVWNGSSCSTSNGGIDGGGVSAVPLPAGLGLLLASLGSMLFLRIKKGVEV